MPRKISISANAIFQIDTLLIRNLLYQNAPTMSVGSALQGVCVVKKDIKKPLRVQRETLCELRLNETQLKDVVGGTNGCFSGGHAGPATACNFCVN